MSFDRSRASIFFHGPHLRTFESNYLILHSPYTIVSHLCTFVLGISPTEKCFLPALIYSNPVHLSKPRPQPVSFIKLSMITAAWNDLSSELWQWFLSLTVLKMWFWDHHLHKCTIICIFTSTRKSCGNFYHFPESSLRLLKEKLTSQVDGEKTDNDCFYWGDQLTHLNHSFLYSFSHKMFWFVSCVSVRSVVSLLTAEILHLPMDFSITTSQCHGHPSKDSVLLPFSK